MRQVAAIFLVACGDLNPAAELPWMVGTWSRIEGPTRVEERWVAGPDGDLLGFGRVMFQSEEGSFLGFAESLTVTTRAGKLTYVAWPAGQDPIEFALTSKGADTVTFENPAHDFPRRIRYAKQPDGTLFAEASGIEAGKEKTESWTLTSAKL